MWKINRHLLKKSVLIFERYRTETALDTSAFTESSFGDIKGQEVYIVQELRNCPFSKYELILTNVRNLMLEIQRKVYLCYCIC
jgi:hypothetical protein